MYMLGTRQFRKVCLLESSASWEQSGNYRVQSDCDAGPLETGLKFQSRAGSFGRRE